MQLFPYGLSSSLMLVLTLFPLLLQLFAFDTAKKFLTPKSGEERRIPIPPSLVAGAFAGVSSTLCTYPLELIKTRLTIQVSGITQELSGCQKNTSVKSFITTHEVHMMNAL